MSRRSRDTRQEECVRRWRALNGHGTIVAQTGFGKSRVGVNIIKDLQSRTRDIRVIIVVPTTVLKDQWEDVLREHGCMTDTIEVLIVNTAIKNNYQCDLLILDEVHRYPAETFSRVFDVIEYYMILCLTATFERLDGKHDLISKYAPIVDRVSAEECKKNHWVSPYKDIVVVVEPTDMYKYDDISREFQEYFDFFGYDFGLVMSMVGERGWKKKLEYSEKMGINLGVLNNYVSGVMRKMQERKKYIYNHPEKYRIAEEIIEARGGEKIITFSASIAGAKKFKGGYLYTGENSKKKNSEVLEEFKSEEKAQLNTCKLADTGLDLPDLTVGIMLGINSSKTKQTQSLGRVIRFQEGKRAEFFTLIMNNTVEIDWWRRSKVSDDYILVDEKNLLKYLQGKRYERYIKPLRKFINNEVF